MIELEDSQIYGWFVRSTGDNLVGLMIDAWKRVGGGEAVLWKRAPNLWGLS